MGIPLVALMGQNYQPENILDNLNKASQFRGSQQAQQQSAAMQPGNLALQQQAVTQGQMGIEQQRAVNDAWRQAAQPDAQGHVQFDPDKLTNALALSGHGSAVPQIAEGLMKMQQTKGDIAKQKADLQNTEADTAGAGAAAVLASNLDPNVKQAFFQHMTDAGYGQQAQQLQQTIAKNPQGEGQIWKSIQQASPKQQQLLTEAATAKAKSDEVALGQARLDWEKQGGAPVDKQELNSWLANNPGKTASDFAAWKAKLAPTATFNLQSGLLSDQAKQMAAQNYQQTGQLPQGMRSPAMSAGILNQAANGQNWVPNIAANKATYAADENSLKSLQKNFDTVTAFENTAGKNLDTFLGTAKDMIDSGSPLVNIPLREAALKVAGSPQAAAFNAARTTALTEIAKVLNSSNASGVVSDSARTEVGQLIGKDATLKQIYSAANILKQDMANRHDSYQNQIADIQKRIAGGSQSSAPSGPPSGATHIVPGPDGKKHYTNAQGTVDLGIAP